MIKSIYAALLLGGLSVVLGFEYKAAHNIKSSAMKSDSFSASSSDDYCLVFEDHFNTFNLKNWQVNTKN